MSEANVTELSKPETKYVLREPNIKDCANFVGALASGVEDYRIFEALATNDEDGGAMQAALLLLFARTIANPSSRSDLLYVLSDLWQTDAGEIDEVPEDWDYDPDPVLVSKGQLVGRDERWRSLTRKHRLRIAKRIKLDNLPAREVKKLYRAFADSAGLDDFLDSAKEFIKANSGASSTESKTDTDGQTP